MHIHGGWSSGEVRTSHRVTDRIRVVKHIYRPGVIIHIDGAIILGSLYISIGLLYKSIGLLYISIMRGQGSNCEALAPHRVAERDGPAAGGLEGGPVLEKVEHPRRPLHRHVPRRPPASVPCLRPEPHARQPAAAAAAGRRRAHPLHAAAKHVQRSRRARAGLRLGGGGRPRGSGRGRRGAGGARSARRPPPGPAPATTRAAGAGGATRRGRPRGLTAGGARPRPGRRGPDAAPPAAGALRGACEWAQNESFTHEYRPIGEWARTERRSMGGQ